MGTGYAIGTGDRKGNKCPCTECASCSEPANSEYAEDGDGYMYCDECWKTLYTNRREYAKHFLIDALKRQAQEARINMPWPDHPGDDN